MKRKNYLLSQKQSITLSDFGKRSSKLAILSLITFFPLVVSLATDGFTSKAQAGLCAVGQVKEVGTWRNPDNRTRGITRAVFSEECRDNSRTVCDGDICSRTFGVKLVYTAKLWGKCHPRDCYWGKVEGTYTSTNWLRFRYNHGFARRTVWAQVYRNNHDWLRLVVSTDFRSNSRRDYQIDDWFRRS